MAPRRGCLPGCQVATLVGCPPADLRTPLVAHRHCTLLKCQMDHAHGWLGCGTQVVSALQFLHEHKILHGDLKAANVLLASNDTDPRGFTAKVMKI